MFCIALVISDWSLRKIVEVIPLSKRLRFSLSIHFWANREAPGGTLSVCQGRHGLTWVRRKTRHEELLLSPSLPTTQ